ncbi:phage late control D family protein [Pyxidicoccus sp. MSG2]|uniref:phage late control D family protein n=1 Tax=Pyxidicoccus sp. MSG2 TaxID=2996790 RepID=UPI00226DA95E|nr:contractile injection system protein, VgrG/Pvc8 family [Pyxidicoccus sp. MSG2]MCY1019285.1 contractile injection system protein, VgrG/Pvc8 family [Pyxidicoccus sp. MSG2]
MINEVVNVSIDGAPQDDLVPDIVQLAVEESVTGADVFRLRLALVSRSDGTWSYVDEPRFQVWKRFSVEAGYPDDTQTLVDGLITHVELGFGAQQEPYLEVSGMDLSAKLDLEEKQLAWANKKDHEIAQAIFSSYGLTYEVEDTVVQHAEANATILQSETDIRFLRRLAARNGFECYVRGNKGYFRSANLQEPPQKLLAVEFGAETNVAQLKVRVDGTPATSAEVRRVDPLEKREETERLTALPERSLGSQPLGALRGDQPEGRQFLLRQPSAAREELQARLRGAFAGAGQFVRVEGDVDGRVYLAVLRSGRLVTLKGVGERYSGLYYVTRVHHAFTVDGYTQSFEARRNGVGLTGEEQFQQPSLPMALVPSLGGGAGPASSGSRVLPPTGSTFGGI